MDASNQDPQKSTHGGFLQLAGLHPLIAGAVVTVDAMLFGGSVITGGIGWIASIPVGLVLGFATTLVQKGNYNDSNDIAVGKGLVVGVLTAIPTALPGVITGTSGVIGLASLVKRRKIQP